jgi:hypothetical protein
VLTSRAGERPEKLYLLQIQFDIDKIDCIHDPSDAC